MKITNDKIFKLLYNQAVSTLKACMYAIVDFEGKFAVQNMADLTLLKSKESGNIIAFRTREKADKLRELHQSQFDLIVEANRYWFIKEKTGPNTFTMRRIEQN